MPNQQQVYQVAPLAEPGALANTAYANPINHNPSLRAASAVTVGGFVWAAEAPATPEGIAAGTLEKWCAATGTGKPIAFVYRVQDAALACNEGSTLTLQTGQPVPAAVKGSFFAVISKGTPAVGNKVFATLADGSPQAGAAGATVEGAAETDFVINDVVDLGSGSYLVLIENY